MIIAALLLIVAGIAGIVALWAVEKEYIITVVPDESNNFIILKIIYLCIGNVIGGSLVVLFLQLK